GPRKARPDDRLRANPESIPPRSLRPNGFRARAKRGAPRNDEKKSVYIAGLIAQDTLTVTERVSSPCATGVGAIGAATILARKTGAAEPSSAMLSGAPSVTPAALA